MRGQKYERAKIWEGKNMGGQKYGKAEIWEAKI